MENAPAPAWPGIDATKDGPYYARGRSPAPGQKYNEPLAKPSKLVPKDSFRIAIQARDGYDDPTRNLQFPGARAIESASSSSDSLHRSTPPTGQDEFDVQQPIPDPKPVNDLQSPNSPTFVTPSLDAEALLRSLSPTPASRQSPLPRVNSQEPLSPDMIPPNPRSPSPLPPLPPLDAVDEETSSPDSADGQAMSPNRPQRIVRFKSRVRISSGRSHHHYPNDYANASLSRSSSVSDSSSISAPLRSAPESLLVFPTHASSLDQTFTADDFSAWLNESGGMGGKKVWHLGADGDDGASSDADDPDERSALLAHRRRRGQQQYMPPAYGVPPMNGYRGPPNLGVRTNMGPPRNFRTPPTGSPLSPPRRRRGGYGSLTASPASETQRLLRSPGNRRRRRRNSDGANESSSSWGWLSPLQWWAGLKFILCCGAAAQEDPTPSGQESPSA